MLLEWVLFYGMYFYVMFFSGTFIVPKQLCFNFYFINPDIAVYTVLGVLCFCVLVLKVLFLIMILIFLIWPTPGY